MVKQDQRSWSKGRADAVLGLPSKCPQGLDALAYSSGHIEGQAQRTAALRQLREKERSLSERGFAKAVRRVIKALASDHRR
jgi:hypothetical protein